MNSERYSITIVKTSHSAASTRYTKDGARIEHWCR